MSGLVHLLTDQRITSPVSCCCLEPGWFVGDPIPLARDNILVHVVTGIKQPRALIIRIARTIYTTQATAKNVLLDLNCWFSKSSCNLTDCRYNI